MVRTIKEGLNKITLAIGDGANDVNMIQEAHLGKEIFLNQKAVVYMEMKA